MNRMRFSASRAGFTLLEMLVVAAIIGILLALLFPVVGRLTASAESAKCISNLRQIGMGIALYIADHDDTLPGPLSGGLHAFYGPLDVQAQEKGGRLAAFLQGYISPPVKVGGTALRSDLFLCPSYVRQMKASGFPLGDQSKPLIRNAFFQGPGGPGVPYYAFGGGAGTANPIAPMRLTQVAAQLKPGSTMAQTWIIKDLDGDVAGSDPSGPLGGAIFANTKGCPPHPVHSRTPQADHAPTMQGAVEAHPGAYRNALFFDFHVGRLSLDDKVQ